MLSPRRTGGIVAAALSLALIVGCSDSTDPVGPASEFSAKVSDAPAPAPLVTVDVGGGALTFWPNALDSGSILKPPAGCLKKAVYILLRRPDFIQETPGQKNLRTWPLRTWKPTWCRKSKMVLLSQART